MKLNEKGQKTNEVLYTDIPVGLKNATNSRSKLKITIQVNV